MESPDDCSGEFELIDWIRRHSRPAPGSWTKLGIGDDCAILRIKEATDLLVTTDMLMDGRHFRLDHHGPEAVGYKALAVNLSDIAAMAGIPRAALVAVALPLVGAAGIVQGLHSGMQPLAERFGVDLVGGDTNAWDGPLVISVTVLGGATERGAVGRAGARPGDAILVTGPLGGSLLTGRHLRPEPRIDEALAIHQEVPIHAMIDLSDGLSSDLAHILRESGNLGAELDAQAIPIHADAHALEDQDDVSPLEHALDDGEDFELCLVVSPDDVPKLLAAPNVPAGLRQIGRVMRRPGMRLRTPDGAVHPIEPYGFDHLRQTP
jgi:thiamine-monophosphate kinase